MQVRQIAVLGAGNVGGTLARIWSKAGHEVVFGLPDPQSERAQKTLVSIPGLRALNNQTAAAGAEIVALSVPWPAAQSAIQMCGDLAGKIVVDCTNPLLPDLSGLALGASTSAAEQVASWAPESRVVKAFNTIGAPCLGNAQFGAVEADGFFCGDHADAKATVRGLIEDAGLNPVDVGSLIHARLLEPMAMLWIDLAVNQRQGTNHAFKLLRR